jgi:hypothetical protein
LTPFWVDIVEKVFSGGWWNFSSPMVRRSRKKPGAYLPKRQSHDGLSLTLDDSNKRQRTTETHFESILTSAIFGSFSTISVNFRRSVVHCEGR